MSEIIEEVLKARYYQPNEKSWNDVCARVANFVGNNDLERKEFFEVMCKTEFIPNSPTLFNAGTPYPLMSACFAIGIDDSMESIFEGVKKSAILFKLGAGVGYNFSRIRPIGSKVGTTQGAASGVLSFMRVYNEAIDVIKQAGRRRGAAIAVLNVDHPEIENFINSKVKEGVFSNFNISVMLTDEFLQAVEKNQEFELKFNNTVYKKVNARELFKKMISATWKLGEPGYLFFDTINRENPNLHLGYIENVNPCGEICILTDPKTGGGESCNLGSIDVSKFVTSDKEFDFKRLERVVRIGVRFLNNIIDKNRYPFEEIEVMTKNTRKIGLGCMGFADALIKMDIPYDSAKAIEVGEKLMEFINRIAIDESRNLVASRGCYPAWKGSKWDKMNIQILNSTLTCNAPTGTISIFAECSSGIEPNFSYVMERKNTVGKKFFLIHPIFSQELKKVCRNDEEYNNIIDECFKKGSIQHIKTLPEWFKSIFKTSLDIDWKTHVKMQAAFQKHTGNSISKTCNFRNDATENDIENAILLAWKSGCKGITIYRQGSREEEVLALKKEAEKKPDYKRPTELFGVTYKKRSGCGKLFVTVNERRGKPYEVFINSEGGCTAFSSALGRVISLALRNGTPVRDLIKQLSRVKCSNAMRNKQSDGNSCADIVSKCITESIPDFDDEKFKTEQKWISNCPECGAVLEFGEGCNRGTCKVCGWSGCS